MTLKLAYNTTDSAIVVDEAGYSVGGHEWGPVDTLDPIGDAELSAGRLVEIDEDAARASDNPDVQFAVAALDERRTKVEQAKAADKQELADALPDEVLETLEPVGDGLPAKDELVDAAVAADVVPEPAPKKSTSSRTAAKK